MLYFRKLLESNILAVNTVHTLTFAWFCKPTHTHLACYHFLCVCAGLHLEIIPGGGGGGERHPCKGEGGGAKPCVHVFKLC